jgi:hypothetical protein
MTTSRSIPRELGKRLAVIAFASALAVGWAVAPVRAEPITDDNVVAAVEAAKTPADHQALAAYFTSKAEAAMAKAEMHKRMAVAFSGKMRENLQMHCNALIRSYKQQAKDFTEMAKEQEKLAVGK